MGPRKCYVRSIVDDKGAEAVDVMDGIGDRRRDIASKHTLGRMYFSV